MPGKTRPTDDLATEVWARLRAVAENPDLKAEEHRLMRGNDLTTGPLRALRYLPLTEPIRMRELAARMLCDSSYVTGVVDLLEERGLADRQPHPTDRRVKVITLTRAGRKLAGEVQRAYTTPPAAFGDLGRADLRTLATLLDKVSDAGS